MWRPRLAPLTAARRESGALTPGHPRRDDPAAPAALRAPRLSTHDASRRAVAGFVAVAVALLMGLVGAASPARADDGGSISGTVTGGHVSVFLYRQDDGGEWQYFGDDSGPDYSFTNLDAGTYTLYFGNSCANEYWGGGETIEQATPIVLGVGQQVSGLSTTIAASKAVLSGVVTDDAGNPVAGARVSAWKKNEFGYGSAGCEIGVSDSAGAFQITGLDAGTYTLSYAAHTQGYAEQWWDDEPWVEQTTWFEVRDGEHLTDRDARLTVGATISGVVTGAAGPVVGAEVVAYRRVPNAPFRDYWGETLQDSSSFGEYITARTDASGAYTLTGLQSGSYTLGFFSPEGGEYAREWWGDASARADAVGFAVVAGQDLTGRDAVLAAGASISGTVTGDDGALPGARVFAYRYEKTEPSGSVWWFAERGNEATTDDTGTYVISGLPAGTYTLGFEFPDATGGTTTEYWADQTALGSADSFTLAPGQALTGLDASPGISPAAITPGTPAVKGTAQVGRTLTADAGTWAPATVALTYQWLRNGSVISGQTAPTYRLVAADLGARISVRVTGALGASSVITTSATTSAVKAGALQAATPTLSGTAKVGSRLTAKTGTWTTGTTFTYQWLRDGVRIAGATRSTYTPSASDATRRLTVRVTGTKPGYTSAAKTSTSVAVAKGTLTTTKVTLSGKIKVGSRVTAVTGTWTPAPVTKKYQWYRNGKPITGATRSTYTPVKADAGKKLTVKVTGSRSGYTTAVRTSTATTVAR